MAERIRQSESFINEHFVITRLRDSQYRYEFELATRDGGPQPWTRWMVLTQGYIDARAPGPGGGTVQRRETDTMTPDPAVPGRWRYEGDVAFVCVIPRHDEGDWDRWLVREAVDLERLPARPQLYLVVCRGHIDYLGQTARAVQVVDVAGPVGRGETHRVHLSPDFLGLALARRAGP